MTLIEPLAAGIVGAVLIWLVLQPLLFPLAPGIEIVDLPDPEETPRGRALLALKEIEFDRATGKLSDVDYADLHSRYSAAAIATLDEPPPVVATSIDSTGIAGAVHCATHGPRHEDAARFCPVCGLGLITERNTCATCDVALPGDALFCPGCGVRTA